MGTQKNRSILIFALPIILALGSLGCGLAEALVGGGQAASLEATPTRTPMPTFTPTPINVVVVDAPAEAGEPGEEAQPAVDDAASQETIPVENADAAQNEPVEAQAPEPEPTEPPPPTPTPEPTDTPASVDPQVTILQNMNVRAGPGTSYPVIGPGPAGETSKIVGRNSDSSWVQVEYPSANGTGWVYSPLVQIDGDPNQVAVVAVAPPPAPTAPPPPPEPAEPPPPPEPQYQFTPTGWHASGNAGIVHFKGRIRDEAGNLVNGYSVLVDNWSWSVLSHPSGASHHYPQKGDGEWDVVIPERTMAGGVGWWWLTVVRYECPNFFAGFDAQCKQFTRLSEDVKIQVNWPDETIINADWICHWDCDKGLYTEGFRQ